MWLALAAGQQSDALAIGATFIAAVAAVGWLTWRRYSTFAGRRPSSYR